MFKKIVGVIGLAAAAGIAYLDYIIIVTLNKIAEWIAAKFDLPTYFGTGLTIVGIILLFSVIAAIAIVAIFITIASLDLIIDERRPAHNI